MSVVVPVVVIDVAIGNARFAVAVLSGAVFVVPLLPITAAAGVVVAVNSAVVVGSVGGGA